MHYSISQYFSSKAENGSLSRDFIKVDEGEKGQTGDESEDDVEIVEDENGQCTVRIKPKPIKLKILNPYASQASAPLDKTAQSKKRKLLAEDKNNINGHLNDSLNLDHDIPTAKKPRLDSKESISSDSTIVTPKSLAGRPKTPTQRDIRTHCDKV